MAKKPAHRCGRCSQSFNSRQALGKHLQNHPDSEPAVLTCTVCNWPFDDSLALEQHRILSGHLQTAETPQQTAQYKCDRCPNTFRTQREYNRHRELGRPCCDAFHASDWKKKSPRPGYIDPDKPKLASRKAQELAYGGDSSDTPSDMSDDGVYCRDCKKTFASRFAFTHHILRCTALHSAPTPDSSPETLCVPDQDQNVVPTLPTVQRHTVTVEVPPPHVSKTSTLAGTSRSMLLQTVTLNTRAPVSRQQLLPPSAPGELFPNKGLAMPVLLQTQASLQAPITPSAGTRTFFCNINGCRRSYGSEPGLKMHQTDAHGVGGQGLDLYGRDSWMLGQRERERLRAEGLLKIPTGPFRGGSSNRGYGRGGCATPVPVATREPVQHTPATHGPYRQAPSHNRGVDAHLPLPTSQNIGGAMETEQAKLICGKTLRLLLQTNIFIHHDGKMSVSGIDWTRIGVERQPAVVGMFDDMCHLPPKLQALEYVPAPKTFMAEYTAQYPVTEFENAPDRNPAKPGLGIIAMACSKIVLSNGRHEVVKIAAVDVLTCRVLMSHLVCTDPSAQVTNWHSSITGLTSFKDMEDARQAGYKVLKGWTAARSALFKFIDRGTIIVGHNVRSELDALRIIHGRAVDIAKLVEKAAQGPLSKAQVSLDSWCRDVANVARLETDPVFGRDCVMSAFAAREIGLWAIKNREQFEKVAKQKTKDYQLVNPVKA